MKSANVPLLRRAAHVWPISEVEVCFETEGKKLDRNIHAAFREKLSEKAHEYYGKGLFDFILDRCAPVEMHTTSQSRSKKYAYFSYAI